MAKSLRIKRNIREDWFRELQAEITEAKTARSDWLGRMRQSYQQYRNILPAKNKPWPGCSNLQPPLTTRACEQVIRRVVFQFIQGGEYIHLQANSATTAEIGRDEKVQEYLRWLARNRLDYFDTIDAFVRQLVIGGSSVMQTEWCFRERMVADVLTLGRDRLIPGGSENPEPQYKTYGQPVGRESGINDILKEVFGSVGNEVLSKKKRSGSKEREVWDVEYSERGVEKEAVVTIDKAEELGDEIEVMAEFRRIVKDQPIIHNLDMESVIVSPGNHTIQEAPLVAVREFVNADYIQAMLDSKKWHLASDELADLHEQLYDSEGKPMKHGPETYDEDDGQKEDDDDFLGLMPGASSHIPVFHVYTEWDLKSDGELVDSHIVMLPQQKHIVYAHYDSVDNRSGMRNMVHRNFLPVRNEFYGWSLPQLVRSLQVEMNTIHNQDVDRDSIINNPFAFIDPAGNLDRDNVVIGPGSFITMMEPQNNVYIPQFPPNNGEGLRRTAQLEGWADSLSTMGPPTTGQSEGRPNAQRTARGLQLLLSQTTQAVEYQSESVALAVVDLWKQIYSWSAAKIRPGTEFRVMGTNEVMAFETREEFRGEFDFIFEAGQAIMNGEMRRFLWTEFFQLAAPVAAAPPEQVPPPLHKMLVEMGKQRGIRNAEKYLPEIPDVSPDPLSPHQEHEMLMAGRPVSTHPRDPIQLHLQEHQLFLMAAMDPRNPSVQLSPAGVKFAEQHMLETIRQYEQQMKQQQQGLGGPFAQGQNPLVNAGPGQPPQIQPEAVTAGGGDQPGGF